MSSESTDITPDKIFIPQLSELAYAAWEEVRACDEGDYRARHALMDFVAERPQVITWLERDAKEGREQRDDALADSKGLRVDLSNAQSSLAAVLNWLGVDSADEVAVQHAKEDLKSFHNWRRRQRRQQVRIGEGNEIGTMAHYEAKLAAKRETIRSLLAKIAILENESGPSVGASDENQKAHAG